MEELMRQDDKYKKLLAAADERQARRIAEVLEKRDREATGKAAEAAGHSSRKRRAPEESRGADGGQGLEQVPQQVPPQAPPQPQPRATDPSGGWLQLKCRNPGKGLQRNSLSRTWREIMVRALRILCLLELVEVKDK